MFSGMPEAASLGQAGALVALAGGAVLGGLLVWLDGGGARRPRRRAVGGCLLLIVWIAVGLLALVMGLWASLFLALASWR